MSKGIKIARDLFTKSTSQTKLLTSKRQPKIRTKKDLPTKPVKVDVPKIEPKKLDLDIPKVKMIEAPKVKMIEAPKVKMIEAPKVQSHAISPALMLPLQQTLLLT